MSFYLNVPFVTQLGIGAEIGKHHGRDDPTGCWYASLCMVGFYFEAGPRLGNPELFKRPLDKKNTVQMSDIFPLVVMQNEGLEEVPEPADKKWKNWQLAKMLKEYGPLMMSWWAPGAHVSVVIGIDSESNEVIYHDPENAPNSRMSLNNFNNKLMWGNRALMRKKGQPHQGS